MLIEILLVCGGCSDSHRPIAKILGGDTSGVIRDSDKCPFDRMTFSRNANLYLESREVWIFVFALLPTRNGVVDKLCQRKVGFEIQVAPKLQDLLNH